MIANALRLAPIVSLVLLAACGRQESVDDLPDANAIVNAASQQVIKPELGDARFIATGKNRLYTDAAHGFSIMLPEGWVRNETMTGPEGVFFGDPGSGADIRIAWARNSGDADFQQLIESVDDNGGAETGNSADGAAATASTGQDYMGTANDGEGNRVLLRILRLHDGSIASATMVFPEMLSDQYEKIARDTLASLKLTGVGAVSVPAVTAPKPAAPQSGETP